MHSAMLPLWCALCQSGRCCLQHCTPCRQLAAGMATCCASAQRWRLEHGLLRCRYPANCLNSRSKHKTWDSPTSSRATRTSWKVRLQILHIVADCLAHDQALLPGSAVTHVITPHFEVGMGMRMCPASAHIRGYRFCQQPSAPFVNPFHLLCQQLLCAASSLQEC